MPATPNTPANTTTTKDRQAIWAEFNKQLENLAGREQVIRACILLEAAAEAEAKLPSPHLERLDYFIGDVVRAVDKQLSEQDLRDIAVQTGRVPMPVYWSLKASPEWLAELYAAGHLGVANNPNLPAKTITKALSAEDPNALDARLLMHPNAPEGSVQSALDRLLTDGAVVGLDPIVVSQILAKAFREWQSFDRDGVTGLNTYLYTPRGAKVMRVIAKWCRKNGDVGLKLAEVLELEL